MLPSISLPSRHYAYFLLSRQIFDVKAITEALAELNLPTPKDGKELEIFVEQILRVRSAMKINFRFNPTADEPNDATLAFMRRWGITDAWRNNPFLAKAMDILWNPPIRRMLELLLLSPMTPRGIAERVATRFNLPEHAMNAGVVRAFKHYFWDFGSMDLAQWREFLSKHHANSAFEFISALQAPRSKAGLAFVLSLVDKDPRLLSPRDRYEMASAAGFTKFMQHVFGGDRTNNASTRDTYAAFAALNIMRMADTELEKYQGADTEFLLQLQRIVPAYDNMQPLSIKDNPYIRPSLPIVTEGEEVKANE